MTIDWKALLLVAVVALITTVVVVSLAAFAARLLDAGHTQREANGEGMSLIVTAYCFMGVIGLIILFGLWLMIPYFH